MAFIERGGWFGADPFLVWLRRKLDSGPWKDGQRQFSGLTMAQLFDRTGVELSLVASDTTDARMLVLNHRTAPGCPVVWAVRMSMSIPLVWNEVVWQSDWGQYLGRDMTGHLIVDGGVLSNFPIELFISDEAHVVKMMGPKGANPVLGLLIDERLPVPQAKGMLVSVNIKPGELRTVQRLQRLVDTATTAHDKMVIEEYENLVVRLPAQGYGTTEFDMSEERRAALVDAGRTAMTLHFDAPRGLRLPTKATRGTARRPTPIDWRMSILSVARVMAKARWTILTYIAAHNNLAMLGKVSLNQILGVGSTPEVVHGMLYDGPGEGGRYVVGDPGTVSEQDGFEEFDGGDPDQLIATATLAVRASIPPNATAWSCGAMARDGSRKRSRKWRRKRGRTLPRSPNPTTGPAPRARMPCFDRRCARCSARRRARNARSCSTMGRGIPSTRSSCSG